MSAPLLQSKADCNEAGAGVADIQTHASMGGRQQCSVLILKRDVNGILRPEASNIFYSGTMYLVSERTCVMYCRVHLRNPHLIQGAGKHIHRVPTLIHPVCQAVKVLQRLGEVLQQAMLKVLHLLPHQYFTT